MKDEVVRGLIWKIIGGMPVEVYDDDDGSVWCNELWELVTPRPEGDYAGSREIGSANLVTALNMVHQKMLINSEDMSNSIDIFNKAMNQLQDLRLIRRKPEKVRETFKIVN